MINVSKSGRLGNNMFQFAFALTMSKTLTTDFVFDTKELQKYFDLNNYNNSFVKTIRTIRYMFSLKFNKWTFLNLNLNVQPSEILKSAVDHSVIYGYFQSEDFFKDNGKAIRRYFTIKKDHKKLFLEKYGALFKKRTVCVAIRLTDYPDWKIPEINYNTPELNFNYFAGLISHIDDIANKNLIFTSDDIDAVKKNLGHLKATYITGEIDALVALTLADELILSNSSFHWWGAWLNAKPDKIVYAPKYWLGHKVKLEYPQNVIPSQWIQVEV